MEVDRRYRLRIAAPVACPCPLSWVDMSILLARTPPTASVLKRLSTHDKPIVSLEFLKRKECLDFSKWSPLGVGVVPLAPPQVEVVQLAEPKGARRNFTGQRGR